MDCITQTPEFSLQLTQAPVKRSKPRTNNSKRTVKSKKYTPSPAWLRSDCIHHQIDKDLVKRLETPDGKYDAVWLLDPNFDASENLYHINWSDEEIDMLWDGMVKQQLDFLVYAKRTDSEWFSNCIEFFNSDMFESYCISRGMSVSTFRQELSTLLKKRLGYDPKFKDGLLDCEADVLEAFKNK